jgi:hypothetical protein
VFDPSSDNPLLLKTNDVFRGGQIGVIQNGVAVPLYDDSDVKNALISDGVFSSIESIEIVYGINPDGNKEEAFVTLIGVEAASSTLVGIVADLTIDGNQLIIDNPEINPQPFATNTCTGTNCAWCEFDRSWFLGRIRGCKPCSRPGGDNGPATCNHSISTGGAMTVLKPMANTLVKNSL